MDVGGAVSHRPAEHVVDHAHNARIVRLALELAGIDRALGRGGGSRLHRQAQIHIKRVVESLAGWGRRGSPAVILLDRVLDGAGGADAEVHVEAGGATQIVEGHDVERIRGRHHQPTSRPLGRDGSVLARHFLGHDPDHIGVEGGKVLPRDGLLAELGA